jgi:hypothetical protein
MQINQVIIRPEEQIIVLQARNALGTREAVSLNTAELDPETKAALTTLINTVTRKLPRDVPATVLAEIQ